MFFSSYLPLCPVIVRCRPSARAQVKGGRYIKATAILKHCRVGAFSSREFFRGPQSHWCFPPVSSGRYICAPALHSSCRSRNRPSIRDTYSNLGFLQSFDLLSFFWRVASFGILILAMFDKNSGSSVPADSALLICHLDLLRWMQVLACFEFRGSWNGARFLRSLPSCKSNLRHIENVPRTHNASFMSLTFASPLPSCPSFPASIS